MKLAIMQPYLFPYLGYFQLIREVDTFILYNDAQFIKSGYINRNRILDQQYGIKWITLPIKKASSYDPINSRVLCNQSDKKKFLLKIENSYRKAPFFSDVIDLLAKIILFEELNLFKYIENSIYILSKELNLQPSFLKSENMSLGSLKSQARVLKMCEICAATEYINPIGGQKLYDFQTFKDEGIMLKFLKPMLKDYQQFENNFIQNLSIIDVLMFNDKNTIKQMLGHYTLI